MINHSSGKTVSNWKTGTEKGHSSVLDYISLLLFFFYFFLLHLIYSLKCFLMASLGGGCIPGRSEAPGGAGATGDGSLLSPHAWAWGSLGFFCSLPHAVRFVEHLLFVVIADLCHQLPREPIWTVFSKGGEFVVPFVFAHLTHSLSIFSFVFLFFLKLSLFSVHF